MRFKIKYIVTLILPLLLVGTKCGRKPEPKPVIQHQYPEDPATTTVPPQNRLEAIWKIDAYTFKGSDIIPNLDTFYQGQTKIADVEFAYSQQISTPEWLFYINTDHTQTSETAFNPDDPEYIIIDNDFRCCKFLKTKWFITPFRYVWNASAKWTITKLYDKELNLVLKTDSGDYKIFFRKKL